MNIRLTEESQIIHVQAKRGRNGQTQVWGEVVGTSNGFVCVLLSSGEYEEFPEYLLRIVD